MSVFIIVLCLTIGCYTFRMQTRSLTKTSNQALYAKRGIFISGQFHNVALARASPFQSCVSLLRILNCDMGRTTINALTRIEREEAKPMSKRNDEYVDFVYSFGLLS